MIWRAKIVVKRGRGKIVDRGNKYPKIHVYIPTGIFRDSSFPFIVGEDVSIVIEDGHLIVEKMEMGP